MKYVKKIVTFFLLLASFRSYSQTEKLNQFWNEYAFTKDLSQKWVLELNFGLTTSGSAENPKMFHNVTQLYVRGWMHYYPAERWKLSLFYAYFYNKNVPELNQEKSPELRSALQATYNLFKQDRLKINLRARFEDRHLENEESNFEAVARFRFQIKAVYPLYFLKIEENSTYLFASEEVFFKTKSAVSGPDFFDRNRATIGLGIPIKKDFQIEVSYANEIMPRDPNNQIVNAVQVNLIFNNLLPNVIKSFQRTKTAVDDGSSGL
ncbi:DUF2490 domain-containing protein [Flavobacterium sp. LC2016-01]|uniref:DUF2490 domain-containing protein n=1 Tax=Flavobacterium sp. LC2016-01 TaxID=2675876 RepID=UPI0012BADC9A|nr:DUF2490 domain-containing protein [Flavobacterium sp. LC2016-01]MTH16617.1 DUF2490 domain-containing protein [Flavobacterium sp. LC2016-01]